MSTTYLLLIIGFSIVFIIVACSVLRWHPLVVLLLAALSVGLLTGMPAQQTLDTTLAGAGTVFASTGFLILLGTFLGEILERTGAAGALANRLVKRAKGARLPLYAHGMGLLVGIPVFCDAGFILLSRLIQSMHQLQGTTLPALQLSLATGLYGTHVLIPPTPGPMGAAGNLGLSDQLGWVIFLGLIVLIPVSIVTTWLIRRMDRSIFQTLQKQETSHHETSAEEKDIPVYKAIIPLVFPLLLIAAGSILPIFIKTTWLVALFKLLGHAVVALGLSSLAALYWLGSEHRKEWGSWFQQALIHSGPIILITAAGGAFGAVLKATPLQQVLADYLQSADIPNWAIYPFAFILAAILKTAQGSSTASLIITSALLFPVMGSFDLTIPQQALVVIGIGAGAMTVSHANDSYFWVIHQYGSIEVKHLYKTYTLLTAVMGIVTLLGVLALYAVTV